MSNILNEFHKMGVIRDGHFLLSSGLHSSKYIQCAKIAEYPKNLNRFCQMLVDSFPPYVCESINCVVSPAIGGILFGYEVAKILGIRFVFCERFQGNMRFRRGFELSAFDRILIVEDVVTTGKSSLEASDCVAEFQSKVVAFSSLVNRSKKDNINGLPLLSLIDIHCDEYTESELPEYLKNIPYESPGSRRKDKIKD